MTFWQLGASLTVERLLVWSGQFLETTKGPPTDYTLHVKTNQSRAPTLTCFLYLVLTLQEAVFLCPNHPRSAPHN